VVDIVLLSTLIEQEDTLGLPFTIRKICYGFFWPDSAEAIINSSGQMDVKSVNDEVGHK
jgi:hypothetical protein